MNGRNDVNILFMKRDVDFACCSVTGNIFDASLLVDSLRKLKNGDYDYLVIEPSRGFEHLVIPF